MSLLIPSGEAVAVKSGIEAGAFQIRERIKAMEFNAGASYLTENEWIATSKYLNPLFDKSLLVAEQLNLNCTSSQRWPMIELSDKNFSSNNVFKFSLNSNYMQDGKIFFELIHQQFSRKWLMNKTAIKSEILATYTLEDLRSVNTVVADIRGRILIE